jgi:hypothetical protein
MKLIMRGHIRDSFENSRLRNFIKKLGESFGLRVVIHTWNIRRNSLSWRTMGEDTRPVDESIIMDYFGESAGLVDAVMVDDDSKISLPGSLEGVVSMSWAPVRGYKLMFYGMMRAAEAAVGIYGRDETVVQMRFDAFSNWVNASQKQVQEFMASEPSDWERIRFMIRPADSPEELSSRFYRWMKYGAEYEPHWTVGIDNIYMAKAGDMLDFQRHMYFNFDNINKKYRGFVHQEWLAMFEAFNPEWVDSQHGSS